MLSVADTASAPQVAITPAEWWELQARAAEVNARRLALQLAEVARVEAERRICAAHGCAPGQDVELRCESEQDGARGIPSA